MPVEPVIVGAVAVVAQGGEVYGLRLAGGQRLWTFAAGQQVAGIWRWQDLVAALTDQAGHFALTGLDAAAGTVRWRLLPGDGLAGGPAATADGGLVVITAGGTLEVVNVAGGTVRWARRVTGTSQGLAARPLPAFAVGAGLMFTGPASCSGSWPSTPASGTTG